MFSICVSPSIKKQSSDCVAVVGYISTLRKLSPWIVTPLGTVKGNASWYCPGYM